MQVLIRSCSIEHCWWIYLRNLDVTPICKSLPKWLNVLIGASVFCTIHLCFRDISPVPIKAIRIIVTYDSYHVLVAKCKQLPSRKCLLWCRSVCKSFVDKSWRIVWRSFQASFQLTSRMLNCSRLRDSLKRLRHYLSCNFPISSKYIECLFLMLVIL